MQLGKHFGAQFTGVCSTPHLDLVRQLGADSVLDYTTEDFTRADRRYDVVFDVARAAIAALRGAASVAEETSSWPYRHDRDLTGFIDGSENPTLLEAPAAALVPEGAPGAAGSCRSWSSSRTCSG